MATAVWAPQRREGKGLFRNRDKVAKVRINPEGTKIYNAVHKLNHPLLPKPFGHTYVSFRAVASAASVTVTYFPMTVVLSRDVMVQVVMYGDV